MATQSADLVRAAAQGDAAWSPDGAQIVCRRSTPGQPASIELRIADADGTHATALWVAPLGIGADRPHGGR